MSNLKEPLEFAMLDALDGPGGILRQEARGAASLQASDLIPTRLLHSTTEQDLLDDGFVLGEVVSGDEIFRRANLPEGWKKQRTEHSMWTEIVDAEGFPRYRIFYKAAFYDRSAHIAKVEQPTFKAGDLVVYHPSGGKEEHGKVVRQSDDPRLWFVLFDGDSTPKATRGTDLSEDWERGS